VSAPFNTIDLATLALKSGEGRRLDALVDPGAVELGGQSYTPHGSVPVRLDVSRTPTGHALRLQFSAELEGLCMRCLEPARFPVAVEAREVHQPSTSDEELTSPYVDGDELDLSAWAHDALLLALPQALLCRPDCAGLCPECGVPLNGADPAEHRHDAAPDPRWAKLRELLDPGDAAPGGGLDPRA
jgi:uncharacterized protein